ncbi:eukaryotic translation initiation factor 5 [Coccinella septempunctata]|uniref:eukaryotic translation initiation factor 5 n=1 Tax=Coccinella septempunctata TaxID=41139 RepID=UPI001D07CC14|nr:eukaryotic translation initiation factor 5 [Coccinella septempunctata]XP_044748349.1 eukaryotic translation initiation factor 5 [Coccinella septempunctata]XP_044748350.1 eukaryotic translation initiation factor 5 [Coccinella septempunctata]XP_044748351.1 eukaryotic translation initiation factor 5 [Coccinella septempunctata]XP_044748352.1 eukaryotic translation initiation factor 5 [Coccinella septempunctata]XP_044748353.1 eukaryotic translation initiation factor 5 [Coccinella septempunctata]
MSINVNRNVSDVFYRYKMPRLIAKVEGKGNGIKTVIANMTDVAKALGRPPTYPTKYFGCELGAQTLFDFKNERYIVNGSHDANKLQDLLDGFIRKFVLCPECDNPETDLLVSTKRNTISQGCKACGYHGLLESNHKLVTYILKNPPTLNPASQGSSLTEGKRSKRSKKNGDSNANGEGQDDQDMVDAPPESIKNGAGDDDDTEWTVDVSEEAVRARMQDLTDGAKNMTISDDLEKTEKERIDILYGLVKSKRDANQLEDLTVQKEIANEAERLEVKTKAPLLLCELLFDQNILGQIKKYRMLILRFTLNDKKAQRYLMGGIEQVIALHKDQLMAKVPNILKVLYDLDVLSETAIIEWSEKVSKKYITKEISQEIHDKAAPFIKWLKEAEEEESDSEESESDVEIEYNDRAQISPLKKKVQEAPAKKIEEEEDVADVDIDAI